MNISTSMNTSLVFTFAILLTFFAGCGDDSGDDYPIIADNNSLPVAMDQSVSTHVLMPVDITLEAEDSNGDELTWIIDRKTEHGLLLGEAQELTYAPYPDYTPYPEESGVDSFTFYVNDGKEDSNVAAIDITITIHKPVAYNQNIESPEDLMIFIDLMASDPDLDGLTWQLDSGPQHGILDIESGEIDTDPNVLYTPDENFHGTDSFTFHVNDGVYDSNVAAIQIKIISLNDEPVAYDKTVTTVEDSSDVAVTLEANDVENDPLDWVIDSVPQHGTIDGAAPDLSYTPNSDFCGYDSLTFHVRDSEEEESNIATVSIKVDGVFDRWYVDKIASGSSDGRSWDTAFLHPMDAMSIAGDKDEVWIKKENYTSNNPPNPALTMKEGVKIYGGFAEELTGAEGSIEGRDFENDITTLDGEESVYHVVVGADNARLDGLTITGGNASGTDPLNPVDPDARGGGMFNDSISVTIVNCIFSSNNALKHGGGIYSANSSLSISSCTISENTSDDSGGGTYSFTCSLDLTDSAFTGNESLEDKGGGMYNDNCSLDIANCDFTNNMADRFGGGIFNADCSINFIITDCLFSDNSASSGGGMSNSNYSSPVMTGCRFINNSAQHAGGGLSNDHSSPSITECTFSGNSATSQTGEGGGLRNHYSSSTITNSVFDDNSAKYGGGVFNNGSLPVVTGCSFTSNHASASGGGIYNKRSSPTIINCEFTGNGGGGMGNIYEGLVTITNSIFTGNESNTSGGGIYNYCSSLIVTNCILYNNHANTTGGAVYCRHCNGSGLMTITNSILWNNSADDGEAEIDDETGLASVNYSDIEGGYAGNNNIDSDPAFEIGPSGDYYLHQDNSPCVNTGDPDTGQDFWDILSGKTTSILGNPDVGIVDMGYHYEP